MKAVTAVIGSIVLVLSLCWALGFVEFTYPRIIANQPLRNPRKVARIAGPNIIVEGGRIIALSSPKTTELLPEEMWIEMSNQVRRSGFEVDVEPGKGHEVTLYVRWPRKFRDSAPPFTIPLIPETVGRSYRKRLALGTFVETNSQPEGAANVSRPSESETNPAPPAPASRH
jgi:hypothetical protein